METNETIICDPRQYQLFSIPNSEKAKNRVTRSLKASIKKCYELSYHELLYCLQETTLHYEDGYFKCIPVQKDTYETWEEEKPVAFLSIVGGTNQYLPNETIKNQLKNGLQEIMETTRIWIKTDGENTSVGKIVEEFAKEEKNLTHVFHELSEKNTNHKATHLGQSDYVLEACITDHLKVPIIMIIIGGDENSFVTAMTYLKMNYPVLVLEGSGRAADFICKGYRLSTFRTSEDKCVLSDTFISEMAEAAKYIYGFNQEERISEKVNCDKLANKLKRALETRWKFIHVHSINDTTHSFDKAIQDILFQLLCKENKQDYEIIENILKYADLWDRPDIAEKEVFNLKNSNLLQMMQGNKDSILSILFKNALVDKKEEIVKQVLDYIQDRKFFTAFLQQNLKDLYVLEMCERDNRKNIVNTVNGVVKKILGSGQWKPFKENEDIKGLKKKTHAIYEGDIFKHLFIWAVLIDRRNLAMIFWKKENNDYICSALYASSLAKKLAEKSSSESFVDQRTDLWESSRQYEDLAYNVMTELYCKDKNRARTLLMTEVEGYNYTTILEIAEKFSLMKFMGHAACQTRLDKIWKGEKLSYTSNVKAITAAFMPMLIMCLVKIHDNKVESTESPDTSCQHKKRPNWMIIYHFYNSPRIKFVFHLMAYMVMIVMFCLFILTDLHPMSDKNPSIYEYMVYAMAGSLMIEEIRQAFVIKQMSRNLMTWFSFWTLYEIVMYSMFLTSVFLRLTLSADKFYHTRMMYAITLGLFIVNGMQFFLASKHIGPKVIMIGRMMYDILFFILIFAVFVFGFGVVYQATMYPNSKLGFQLFKEIIYMPYWQLYGELFLPEFEGKEPSTCSHDVTIYSKGNIARCPEVNQINTLLLAIYMVVTHIILVNILIAMFSNTFTKVQNNNELVWKFHRYSLVQEYYDKSMLIPPFIILSHMVSMVQCIYLKCRGITHRHNMFKIGRTDLTNKSEEKAVYRYFNLPARMRRYHAKTMEAEKDELEASYEQDTELNLKEQFDLLSSEMDSLQENQFKTLQAINQLKEKQQKLLIVDVNSKTHGKIFVPMEVPIKRSKLT